MEQFISFINKLKTETNSSLIESIQMGYQTIFESSQPDLNSIANDLSNKLHCDKTGSCVHFAELFVLQVNKIDSSLLNEFNVIEGYVDTPIGDGIPQQHTWIELNNGEKIDPTFIQFGNNSYYNERVENKYTGTEYLKDTLKGTWFSERRKLYPDQFVKTSINENVEDEEELEEILRWENLSPKQKDLEIALKHKKKPAKQPVEKVSRKPAHKHPEEWKKAVEMAKNKYSPKTKMMWMQAEIIYQKMIRNK